MANSHQDNAGSEHGDEQAGSSPPANAGYPSLGTPATGMRKWRGAKDGFSR